MSANVEPSESVTENYSERIFKNDPLDFLQYVGKMVQIDSNQGHSNRGTVVTIDPVTESVVLVNEGTCGLTLNIVLGHSIRRMTLLDEPPISFMSNFNLSLKDENPIDDKIKKRFLNLKSWLHKNMIPVEENGSILQIAESLSIQPPYRKEDVICSNEIVLHRVLNIIERMPQEN